MKITKKEHKGLLHSLFFDIKQQVVMQKNFPLNELFDAGSAFKKIREGIDEKSKQFVDGDMEFTPAEVVVLKKLFDGQLDWAVGDAQFVKELQDIFGGKHEETKS